MTNNPFNNLDRGVPAYDPSQGRGGAGSPTSPQAGAEYFRKILSSGIRQGQTFDSPRTPTPPVMTRPAQLSLDDLKTVISYCNEAYTGTDKIGAVIEVLTEWAGPFDIDKIAPANPALTHRDGETGKLVGGNAFREAVQEQIKLTRQWASGVPLGSTGFSDFSARKRAVAAFERMGGETPSSLTKAIEVAEALGNVRVNVSPPDVRTLEPASAGKAVRDYVTDKMVAEQTAKVRRDLTIEAWQAVIVEANAATDAVLTSKPVRDEFAAAVAELAEVWPVVQNLRSKADAADVGEDGVIREYNRAVRAAERLRTVLDLLIDFLAPEKTENVNAVTRVGGRRVVALLTAFTGDLRDVIDLDTAELHDGKYPFGIAGILLAAGADLSLAENLDDVAQRVEAARDANDARVAADAEEHEKQARKYGSMGYAPRIDG